VSTWTYYAVFEPPLTTLDHPATLLRQRPGADREDAERLIRTGDWSASDLLQLVFLGHNDREVVEIDRPKAVAIAYEFAQAGTIPTVPPDLF
jgi:hypothetical protein